MQPKEQYELYKIFCDLMRYDVKCFALSTADTELYRRYVSCVSSIRRYLVQTFAHLGVHDVYAHKAIDFDKGKFVGIPDSSFWFVNPERYPELGTKISEMEKLFNAKNNCHRDYFKLLRETTYFLEEVLVRLRQYSYIPSPKVKKKVDIVVSIRDLLDGKGEFNKKGLVKSIASNYTYGKNGKRIDTDHYVRIVEDPSIKKVRELRWNTKLKDDPTEYAADGSPYILVAVEIEERRKYINDFVTDVFNYFYRYFKQGYDEVTFYKIFDTAHFDTRYKEGNSIEKSFRESYKLYDIPENLSAHIFLDLESLTSNPKPQPKPSNVTSKPKKTSATETKKEVSKKVTPKKEETVTSKKKVETNDIVKKEEVKVEKIAKKETVNEEAVNVLDISTYTKLYNGYKIDKVENKAKKIIIDDRVVELNSRAFLECYKLEEITIGKKVDTIKFGQFMNLKNLVKVNLNDGLAYIESSAFENTNLQGSITIPQSVMLIGKKAFDVINPNILEIHVSSDTMYDKNSFHNLIKLYVDGKLKEKEVIKEEYVKEEKVNPFDNMPTYSSYIRYEDKPFDIKKVESNDYCDDEFAFYKYDEEDGRCVVYDIREGHEVMLVPPPINVIDFEISHHSLDEACKVRKLILGDDVEEISPRAFDKFLFLEELVLPNNNKLTSLPKKLLGDGLIYIKHLEIPNCVKVIHPDCFIGSNISYLTIGKDVDISKVNFDQVVHVYIKK